MSTTPTNNRHAPITAHEIRDQIQYNDSPDRVPLRYEPLREELKNYPLLLAVSEFTNHAYSVPDLQPLDFFRGRSYLHLISRQTLEKIRSAETEETTDQMISEDLSQALAAIITESTRGVNNTVEVAICHRVETIDTHRATINAEDFAREHGKSVTEASAEELQQFIEDHGIDTHLDYEEVQNSTLTGEWTLL